MTPAPSEMIGASPHRREVGGPPRVTIGMPVYNGERYLDEAIEAITDQTFDDFEVVICDNDSTDRTEQICRAWAERDSRVHYHRNPKNIGAARNYNRTVELARGEYFKWFAHDDLIAPTFLEKLVVALDAAPEGVVLCSPRRRHVYPDRTPVADAYYENKDADGPDVSQAGVTLDELLAMSGSNMSLFIHTLMRTDALRRTRLTGSYISADLVLAMEMRLQGEFIEVPEVLYFQRIKARTPDLVKRLTKRGQAAWFDPEGSTVAALFPSLNLFWQRLIAIHRVPMPLGEKLSCYWSMRHHVAFRTKRRFKRRRSKIIAGISHFALRALPTTSLPVRFLYLATGVVKRDRARIRASLARGSGTLPTELDTFARERLMPLARSLETFPTDAPQGGEKASPL